MTDSRPGKPSDTAIGADPAASDLSKILTAIQDFKTLTDVKCADLTTRLDDLEKDIVDGSEINSVPTTSSPGFSPTTTTVTPASSNVGNLASLFAPQPTSAVASPFAGKHFLGHDSDEDHQPKKKCKKSKSKILHDSSEESDPSNNEADQIDPELQDLMREYEASKPKYLEDPTTTDIAAPLATLLQTWFWSIYSKEVKNELAKPLRPSNANALIPTKINEAVFRSLQPAALTKDLPSRFIHNAFMKASQPFVVVWSTLIKRETFLKSQNNPLQFVFSDGSTVDFLHLRKQMDQGLRILGIANSQMVVHRKDILAQFLNKDFKKLCKPHVPFDQWMFSTNLKGLLEDTIRVNRMVQQNKGQPILAKKPFFRGRGGPQGPRRGGFNQTGYQQKQGKGFGRGWQQNSTTLQAHSSKKTGNQFKQTPAHK